ncbi:MAG: META domain-containing protein [Deltaproteobacteria bacterium]|nr:META domain-containing protein [Deltaproteobacteria bacterium]
MPALTIEVALATSGGWCRRGPALRALVLAALVAGAPALASATLSRDVLGGLAYEGLLEDGGPVRLRGGRWTGPPAEPGLATRPTAALIPYLIVHGDLDGDGRPDALVFLQTTGGGSGAFLHLAAVLDRPEGPRALPAQPIGDRAEVEALAVDHGRVVLDAVVAGPNDALCCPSQRVRRTFEVEDGELRPIGFERRGRLRVRELAGTSWRLTRLDAATPVPADAGIELRFEGAKVAGSGGCNTFQAEVISGERDAVELGPLATTRRACPAPVLAREQRFFAALERATRIGFWFGRLEIQYDTPERRTGRLRFAPGDAPAFRSIGDRPRSEPQVRP